LENLCLDSLIIYFDKLIQIYNKLYQIKEKEEEEANENSDNDSSSLNNCNSNEEDEEDEEGVLKLESDDILKLKNIFEKINNYLKSKKAKGELFYTSDRLNKLYYTINKLFENDKNAKFIIFITNRIVAHILNPTLSRYLEEKFPDKKSQEIIGLNKRNKSQSSLTLAPTITLNKLNQIVKDFNENKFDILIGTSAVEEGLDIQSCNAVISLAEIQTPKSYIQMKGRARKTNSRFYIFSYSKEETICKVRNFLEIQKKMRELFNGDIKKDFRRNNYIYNKKEFDCYFDPDTHSKLTLGNVSIFYNDIKQQIDLCEVKFIPKINIENVKNVIPSKFIGKISLNTDLKKLKNGLSYKTNMCSSKDEAIKKCQFWLLIGLIQTGYLDKHLKFCKEKIKNNQ
jgi:ERCC4-related helicase